MTINILWKKTKYHFMNDSYNNKKEPGKISKDYFQRKDR